jgi:hypothetical protein
VELVEFRVENSCPNKSPLMFFKSGLMAVSRFPFSLIVEFNLPLIIPAIDQFSTYQLGKWLCNIHLLQRRSMLKVGTFSFVETAPFKTDSIENRRFMFSIVSFSSLTINFQIRLSMLNYRQYRISFGGKRSI